LVCSGDLPLSLGFPVHSLKAIDDIEEYSKCTFSLVMVIRHRIETLHTSHYYMRISGALIKSAEKMDIADIFMHPTLGFNGSVGLRPVQNKRTDMAEYLRNTMH
jgi:hypothetical protein